jgi:hypothetical protein
MYITRGLASFHISKNTDFTIFIIIHPERRTFSLQTLFNFKMIQLNAFATCYGLGGPRIESRSQRSLCTPSDRPLRLTQPSCTMGTGSVSWGVKRPEFGVDHPPHLTSRLKKEWSYVSTSHRGLRGLFYGEIYLYLYLHTMKVSLNASF